MRIVSLLGVVSMLLSPALCQVGVQQMIEQAKKESEGGKKADPARKWADKLWNYYEQHQGTEEAGRAAAEALHLLVHAGQKQSVGTRAEGLALDDPAWSNVMEILLEAGDSSKDYSYVLQKAQNILERSSDPRIRAKAARALGYAFWRTERLDEAKAAFERVLTESSDSKLIEEARGNTYELTRLRVGQPGPAFETKSIAGEPLSLTGLAGKVVLVHFWGSW